MWRSKGCMRPLSSNTFPRGTLRQGNTRLSLQHKDEERDENAMTIRWSPVPRPRRVSGFGRGRTHSRKVLGAQRNKTRRCGSSFLDVRIVLGA